MKILQIIEMALQVGSAMCAVIRQTSAQNRHQQQQLKRVVNATLDCSKLACAMRRLQQLT